MRIAVGVEYFAPFAGCRRHKRYVSFEYIAREGHSPTWFIHSLMNNDSFHYYKLERWTKYCFINDRIQISWAFEIERRERINNISLPDLFSAISKIGPKKAFVRFASLEFETSDKTLTVYFYFFPWIWIVSSIFSLCEIPATFFSTCSVFSPRKQNTKNKNEWIDIFSYVNYINIDE